MKKTLIMALACGLFAINANAQTEKWYGGEQGSFAISINAEPVINFAGNMLNGTVNNALDTKDLAKTIAVKYFVSDNLALTAKLDLDNSKTTTLGREHLKNLDEITSKTYTTKQDIELRVGIQNYFRPGKRLQPFFGANVLFGRENTISKADLYAWDYKLDGVKYERDEEFTKTAAPQNTIGLTACLGVELFLSKNISISTSLDLGANVSTGRAISKYDTENDDVEKEDIKKLNYNRKSGSSVSLATGQLEGDLSISFYF